MKRFGNIYPQICDKATIREAFENAAKGKSNYREVRAIRKDMDEYLDSIHSMLVEKTFKNSPYEEFSRIENHKMRLIHKLPFYPDRIIQHAICLILEPIWKKQFIRDTFSCIKGRGVHDGVRRVKRALINDPDNTKYCLKLDIKKYYQSVDNEIMKNVLRKKIKCNDTLLLLDEIVDSKQGLPIGNYTSQLFANLYLSDFDHYVKEQLNVKYYYRYCDDLVFMASSKEVLRDVFYKVKAYLQEHLKLELNDNWQIFPIEARGIDFLGYRFFRNYTLLRKRIAKSYKRKSLRGRRLENWEQSSSLRSSMASYEGWMKHANCHNLKQTYSLYQ